VSYELDEDERKREKRPVEVNLFFNWKKCGTTEPNDAPEKFETDNNHHPAIEKKTRGNRTQTPTREHINPTSAEVSFFERAILRDVCDLYTKLKAWREEREEKRLDFRAIGFKGIKKKRRKPSKDKFDNAKRVAREEDAKSPRSIQTIRNAPRKGITIQTLKKTRRGIYLSLFVRVFPNAYLREMNEDFCKPKSHKSLPFFALCLWFALPLFFY